MARRSRANRTDANQQEIVDALRAIGCHVHIIEQPVDLLVGYKGENLLIEVKGERGTLTEAQKEFMATWPGPCAVIRTAEHAVEWVQYRRHY